MQDGKLMIQPKGLKGDDGSKTVNVRMKEEMYDELERIAGITGRSRSDIVRIFIDYALRHYQS